MSSNERKTSEDYHALAANKGCKWVGTMPSGIVHHTTWECDKGHTFTTTYATLRRSRHGCPVCAGNRPKTIQGYHAIAEHVGLEWLGPLPVNTKSKSEWRCPQGHLFKTSYASVSNSHGTGCPICAGNRQLAANEYCLMADKCGFIWLGPFVTSARAKTQWQCKNGHIWSISYEHIRRGDGCPYCNGNARKTPQEYHQLAKSKGYEWLGPEVNNTETKTQWRCPKGHLWETTYFSFSTHNCPSCYDFVNGAAVSGPQRELWKMLGGTLNHPAGNRYTIDVAITVGGVNIACEWDCHYWHRIFADTTAREVKRDTYLISQGWRVLRIKANIQLPTREQLDVAIQRLLDGDTYTEIVLDWKGG